jgi:hypothetical protein
MLMDRNQHGAVSNLIIMLNGTIVLPRTGLWRLAGVTLYRGVPFEIT